MPRLYQQLTIVFLAGLPGTGKTTLAWAMARRLRWPALDKDTIHTGLLAAGLPSPQAASAAYDLLFRLAHDIVCQQRLSLIIDTAGRQRFAYERAVAIAHDSGARLKVIRCVAPAPIRAERLAQRAARPSQWTTNDATDADQEAWYAHLPPDTLTLSTDGAAQTTLAAALAFLRPPADSSSRTTGRHADQGFLLPTKGLTMTAHEITTAKQQYRSRIETLLTADELARFDAYQQRMEEATRRQDPAPLTPSAEEQAVLTKLAEDTQAAALQKQLDVLLRIETLPQ